jgi:hypothetical protein
MREPAANEVARRTIAFGPRRWLFLVVAAAAMALSTEGLQAQQTCPCSIWTLATAPGPVANDSGAVELGVKFRADSNGFLTGLRFYKYAQNTGTHVGSLWTTAGALLGTLTFGAETASGWQQASFQTPIAITAGTTYVASYHTNTGFYAATNNGLTAGVDNAPLHILSDSAAGGNGVYRYGAVSAFPNQTYAATNYSVDVVFATTLGPDTTPPTVTAVAPSANATGVSTTTAVSATFSETMDPASLTGSTVTLRNSSTGTLVAATVSASGAAATLTPTSALLGTTSFTALVKGGAGGVKDAAGNALTADFSWSFTTAATPTCPCSIWTAATTPGPVANDSGAVELGVKFRADTNGFLTGLRFYKYAQNTGSHVGSVWTTAGTLLGTLTFSGETASGWQEASFPSAVAVTGGTTYVASYHSNAGFYAATNNGLTAGVDTGPLHALSDAAAGGNGMYRYSAGSAFPNQTYAASNYWVDVVFALTTGPDTTPPTVTTVMPAANATGVSTTTAITAAFNEAMSAASISGSTVTLRNTSTGAPVPATVTASGSTATLTPAAPLPGNTTFTALVAGGAGGVKDLAGNALAADYSWSFTTATPPSCPCSIWTLTTAAGPAANDGSAVELGVKFRADTSGFLTGLRYYKYAQNTGAHIGSVWTTGGTLLGTLTFSGETASGWQQASFASPVAVTAGTTYVASYHTNAGFYAATNNGLTSGVDTGPLHAVSDAIAGGNGVYRYASASVFPNQTFAASNYWVDVVFALSVQDTTAPTITVVNPASGAAGAARAATITAAFSEAMDPSTISGTSVTLRDASATPVSATVAYSGGVATLTPTALLASSTTYTALVKGGATGVKDQAGNALVADFAWSFTTAPPPTSPNDGAGGPILVVAGAGNPFTRYYAEILRAEGLNGFAVADLAAVTDTLLASYDVVILGEQTLTPDHVTMFTSWVSGGGNLIAMRPDKKLAGLLGLSDAGGVLSNSYLAAATAQPAAAGIVSQPIQFHGAADQYVPAGAAVVATLYSDATHATAFPAVTLRAGAGGTGGAAAFTFDLARSIVYTRQGNPAWAGQERDGLAPIRSDDLFFGAKSGDIQPDWVDLSKVAIPQGDEQQRLLANLIVLMNSNRKPLPRFWYFPRGTKAVVVMTGDDHANGGTIGRFNQYLAQSRGGCIVDNWECIRSSSFVYAASPITDAQVGSFVGLGFDISLHLTMDPSTQTGCGPDFTPATLANAFTTQLGQFRASFPSAPVTTHRMHCLTWSDWSTQAQVEFQNGIRFDTTYYYWPGSWVSNRPGMFTGSGMPMRYAALDGTMIDVYQAASQLTDESSQVFPSTVNTLLDNAIGASGYYGAFTANMHTDLAASAGSDAIVSSALARSVPIVSAKQMLTWIDGRNASTFGPMTWSANTLGFSVTPGSGANGLQVMIPTQVGALHLTGVTLNGAPVTSAVQTIKGVQYAFVTVAVGQYQATYVP